MYCNIDYKLKKKKLLDLILSKNRKTFTVIMMICILLDILGIALFFASIIIFSGAKTFDGKIVGTLGGLIFLLVLILISECIRKKSIRKLGSPYSEMEKEFIHLEKAGIEFGYHDILNRFPTSVDLYQIYYEDINDIKYDSKLMLLSITGVAQLTVYDDFYAKRINHNLSQRRFYSDSEYSIILAFAEAEEIVEKIKKRGGLL